MNFNPFHFAGNQLDSRKSSFPKKKPQTNLDTALLELWGIESNSFRLKKVYYIYCLFCGLPVLEKEEVVLPLEGIVRGGALRVVGHPDQVPQHSRVDSHRACLLLPQVRRLHPKW